MALGGSGLRHFASDAACFRAGACYSVRCFLLRLVPAGSPQRNDGFSPESLAPPAAEYAWDIAKKSPACNFLRLFFDECLEKCCGVSSAAVEPLNQSS